jgi:hypothetical protein
MRALSCLGLVLALGAWSPHVSTSATPRQTDIFVGALEEHVSDAPSAVPRRVVRVLFRKSDGDWVALPSCANAPCSSEARAQFPREVHWTIAFSGRRLGRVAARTPDQWQSYSDIGQQEIISAPPIPTVGTRSEVYAGWMGVPVLRPLVAVSEPFTADPEGWRPAPLAHAIRNNLMAEFRSLFPVADNCASAESDARPTPYRDSDIQLVGTYASNASWRIATLSLKNYRCDGPGNGGPQDPFEWQEFAISPNGVITHIGTGLRLVDAGDYDNDGRSELIFAKSEYNEDGYALYYADFAHRAEFTFHYH